MIISRACTETPKSISSTIALIISVIRNKKNKGKLPNALRHSLVAYVGAVVNAHLKQEKSHVFGAEKESMNWTELSTKNSKNKLSSITADVALAAEKHGLSSLPLIIRMETAQSIELGEKENAKEWRASTAQEFTFTVISSAIVTPWVSGFFATTATVPVGLLATAPTSESA